MLMSDIQSLSVNGSGSAGTPRIAEGERRHVAALFLDLKDFTSLSESMDHEAVHSLVGGVMKVLAGVVNMHGGYVDKIEGDRIMALFGARKAAENDSIRAVSCALAMLRLIAGAGEYLITRGIEISARTGIACGTVTVAPDALGHLTAMGDTINLASRLETLAEEGTILVTGRVQRECGDFFTWQEKGEQSIRGRISTVQTWRPTGPGPVQMGRWNSSKNVTTAPLTGRSRELEIIEELFQKQRSCSTGKNRLGGSRHILLSLQGAAGIGKSRLVDELLLWKGKNSDPVLRGHAVSFAQPPFDAWISLLRNFAEILPGDPEASDTLAEKISETAASLPEGEIRESLLESSELLTALVSLEEGQEPDSADQIKDLHLKMMLSVRNFIRALAREKQAVIVLDNMHNCDTASLEALSFLLSNCHQRVPLLVIFIQRPGEENLLPPVKADYCEVHELTLGPLSDFDCKGIMRRMTGSDLPDKAVSWISDRSGGNPFYLIELLRYLLDSGRLEKDKSGWRLSESIEETVPDSLAGLVRSRIDCMNPLLRRVLQYCSVLGQEFTLNHYRVYRRMAGLSDRMVENLDDLEKSGFLEKKHGNQDVLYSFRNPLFCISAYDTLLHFNRKTLHKIAAESKIEALGDSSFGASPEIACHFQSAGLVRMAVKWGIKAMDLHMKAYRNHELIKWAKTIEEWISRLEEHERKEPLFQVLRRYEVTLSMIGSTKRRKEVLDRLKSLTSENCCSQHLPWLLKEFGGYSYITGNPVQAVSFYEKALKGAEDTEDRELKADILSRLGEIASAKGEVSLAEQYFSRALKMAKSIGSPSREASVLTCMGTLSLNRGHAGKALELYRKAESIAASENQRNMRMKALANTGMTLSIQEKGEEALMCFETALAESREMGDRMAEGAILGNMGILHQNHGRMEIALECFESALQIARETENRKGEGIVLGNMGILHNHQGRLIKARECYSRSLELRREAGNRRGQAVALLNMGSLDLELGSIRSARDCFRNALEIAREIENPSDEAVALGNLGLVHLHEKRLDEAEKHVRESITISEKTGAKKNLVSSLHTMGLILFEKKDNAGAEKVLNRALQISVDIGNRQKECLMLSALGCIDLEENRRDSAAARYNTARTIINELDLGRKDMEMFLRLYQGLIPAGTGKTAIDIPDNWK